MLFYCNPRFSLITINGVANEITDENEGDHVTVSLYLRSDLLRWLDAQVEGFKQREPGSKCSRSEMVNRLLARARIGQDKARP
jgi:hypothetical protein